MADKRTLTVSMRAEVAHLRKGINESVSLLGKLQSSSMATASAIKAAFVGGAAMYAMNELKNGVKAVVNEFKETAAAIEETKHLSDALGIAATDLQVLQRAAALAEVDIDMLGRNMKVFTKNLGQAAMGKGPAVDMFKQMGVSVQSFMNMPITEQLAFVGNEMKKLSGPAERAAMATALFGRAGIDMIPFLTQSADGLREIQDEMMATGEIYSEADAAMVDEMGDSVTMAWGLWNALKNEIVIGLAPAIKAIADMVRQFGMQSSDVMRNQVLSGITSVIDGIGSLLDNFNKLKSMYYLIGYTGSYIGASLTKAWQMVGQSFVVVMTGIQELFFRTMQLIGKGIDGLTFALSKLANAVPGVAGISGTNISGSLQGYVDDAKAARQKAFSQFGSDTGGSVQKWLDSMVENERRFVETFAKESTLGDKFRELVSTPMDGMMDSPISEIYDDTMDILPELEKEKAIRDDINNTMKDTADLAKEIKDYGEGTSYRTGEYSPRVGGVSGGIMGGAMADGIGMSASAVAATTQGNTRTGADQNTTLLQGILEATRMTATNTMRAPVAVLG